VHSIAAYDSAVIGSGVYMGRWLGHARDFVDEHASELSRMPVWMFSSGPITDKVDPADAADGIRLLEAAHGREHKLFAGKLDKDSLGLLERTVVRMVHPVYGDYRPWAEIEAWAKAIATELTAVAG
jgi:menaquinone-dependent protoporphyrinogen oxidase